MLRSVSHFFITLLLVCALLISSDASSNSPSHPPSSSSGRREDISSNEASSAALIISTVDGVLYTLDAFHGTLRGMFQSGPALVSQMSMSENIPSYSNKHGESFDIIPGLDGTLYSYHSHELHQLPMRVQDVLTGPISTCFDSNCAGVVMGQSTKKLIAVDPSSGKVKWIHEADFSGHGFHSDDGHSESHTDEKGSNTNARENRTVLLQREDYNVKHVDVHTGTETWAVHLGSVQALDMGKRSTHGVSRVHINDDRDYDRVSFTAFDIHSHFLPRNEKENENAAFDNEKDPFSLFESNHPRSFPSIAFGEDGTTVFGVDVATMNIIWKKRFGSVVASVYGVDSDANWVDLNVIDVQDLDVLDGDSVDEECYLPSIEPEFGENLEEISSEAKSKKLISFPLASSSSIDVDSHISNPFLLTQIPASFKNTGAYDMELTTCDDDVHFTHIGFEGSSVFVAPSRLHKSLSACSPNKLHFDLPRSNNFLSLPHSHVNEDLLITSSPENKDFGEFEDIAKMYARLISLNISHKTEHGLFLTWKMVLLLFSSLMFGIVGGRYVYTRKKKDRIEQSPALLSLPRNFQSHRATPQMQYMHHPRIEMQPLKLGDTRAINNTSEHFKERQALISGNISVTRSASLPQLNKYFSGGTEDISVTDFRSESKRNRSNTDELDPLPPFADGTYDSIAPNKTENHSANDATSSLSLAGVSTIDGIPFYRYTRYQSEFQEIIQLGEGGFGTVFKCSNTLDRREYAVKKVLLRSGVGSDGRLSEQFTQKLHRVLREVKILALLDHPNIVRYCTAWLELEVGDHDYGSPKKKSNFSRGFSSEYLVGTSVGGSLSPRRDMSNSYFHSDKFGRVDSKVNPLHLGSFSFLDNDQFDDQSQNKMEGKGSSSSLISGSDEDTGFSWEDNPLHSRNKVHSEKREGLATIDDSSGVISDEESSSSPSDHSSSSSDILESTSNINWTDSDTQIVAHSQIHRDGDQTDPTYKDNFQGIRTSTHKYVLYIQMQLCLKTLQDYLRSRGRYVDIPSALRLFSQIARGMKFVHEKGLIHRDLKPANCFMDDNNCVKIGDFGLSRESADLNFENDLSTAQHAEDGNVNYDNTVGVGTMNYASPEQINGSDYDSSSDVYSLGIILFELCHPMYTGMERFKAFEGIRKAQFPEEWHNTVAKEFPHVHSLIVAMISTNPSHRPTAAQIVTQIDALVNEHTVSSLDTSSRSEDSIFIRVEATCSEGVLARTMTVINETGLVCILQYSLRVNESKAIMEFALKMIDSSSWDRSLGVVFEKLRDNDEITVMRRIFSNANPSIEAPSQKQRTLSN